MISSGNSSLMVRICYLISSLLINGIASWFEFVSSTTFDAPFRLPAEAAGFFAVAPFAPDGFASVILPWITAAYICGVHWVDS